MSERAISSSLDPDVAKWVERVRGAGGKLSVETIGRADTYTRYCKEHGRVDALFFFATDDEIGASIPIIGSTRARIS